jgi:hypothetical protein
MIKGQKSCIVIKSFCNTEEKLKVLDNCINFLRDNYQIGILLHAAYPVPDTISNKVDYLISYDNSVYGNLGENFEWHAVSGHTKLFRSYTFGFTQAEFLTLMETSFILKLHKCQNLHMINYDVDVYELKNLSCIEQHELLLQNHDVCFHTMKENYASLLFYSLKVDAMKVIDENEVEALRLVHHPYVAENAFYALFSSMNYIITRENFIFNDFISTPYLSREVPTQLQELITVCGVYSEKDSTKCMLLTICNQPQNIEYLVDDQRFTREGTYQVIQLESYPKRVLVQKNSEWFDLFTQDKLQRMKMVMFYE